MKIIFIASCLIFCVHDVKSQSNIVDSVLKLVKQSEKIYGKIGILSEAIDSYERHYELYAIRANFYALDGNSKGAIKDLDIAIELNPNLTSLFIKRGLSKYDMGLYNDAIEDYDIALIKEPNNSEALLGKARSEKQLGRYQLAIKNYTTCIATCNKNKNDAILSKSLSGRGNAYFYLGDLDNAILDFNESIKIDSTNGYNFLKLGIIAFNKKDYEQSLTYLNKYSIPRLLYKGKEKYDLLCEAYIYISKNNSELYKTFDSTSLNKAHYYADLSIKTIKTNETYAYYMKGRANYESGLYEKALFYLNKAIGNRSDDVRYLVNRANTYYKLGALNTSSNVEISNDYYIRSKTDYEAAYKNAPGLSIEENYFSIVKNKVETKIYIVDSITNSKYYAILIGIDNYSNQWSALKNPVNDCRAIYKILMNQYSFTEIDTLYNDMATRVNIIQLLEEASQKAKDNNKLNILIYYAGHGEFKKDINMGFWVPQDASTTSTSQYISNADIKGFITSIASNSKHTLLIADACFSGDIFRSNSNIESNIIGNEKYYNTIYKRKSTQVLTSGGIEPVSDGGGMNNHSIFAGYLINELEENKEQLIDISQIFQGIKRKVTNNSNQSPILGTLHEAKDEGGQFIFTKK